MTASAAGHTINVDHVGRRFRLACTCGWVTKASDPRKAAFAHAGEHITQIALTVEQSGDDLGVSLSESAVSQ
jgi:hypothetical protein